MVVGLIVVGIAVVTIVTIRAGTDTAPKGAKPSPATTTALSGPAAELVRLAQRGTSVNIDVAYTGSDPSGPLRSHLWRRSPLARVDTESGSGDGAKRSAQLVTSTGPIACTQAGSAPWSCVPKPDLRIGDLSVVSPALLAKLSTLAVSVRDDRILDQASRCFTVTNPTATAAPGTATDVSAELCLTSDGIPVRVKAGTTNLGAVSLNRGRPPDEVFKPPV